MIRQHTKNHIKHVWKGRRCLLPGILGVVFFTFSPASSFAGDTVYYTLLTCKPEQNVFKMVPKNITKAELEKKTDAQSEALKKQDYAVFLNGEAVGKKTFKDTCALENGVSVEVDINYDREMQPVFKKDFPEVFEIVYQAHRISPTALYRLRGEVDIRKDDTLVGSISNPLIDNSPKGTRFSILVIGKEKLILEYPNSEYAEKQNADIFLKNIIKELLVKKYALATN